MSLVRACLVAIILAGTACGGVEGCAESRFELAADSPLPRGLDESEWKGEDVRVVLSYSIPLSGPRKAVIQVIERSSGEVVDRVDGVVRGNNPTKLHEGESSHPLYETIDLDGAPEIIEHRTSGGAFYVVRDNSVRCRLVACG